MIVWARYDVQSHVNTRVSPSETTPPRFIFGCAGDRTLSRTGSVRLSYRGFGFAQVRSDMWKHRCFRLGSVLVEGTLTLLNALTTVVEIVRKSGDGCVEIVTEQT